MYSALVLDNIIINLFKDITRETTDSVKSYLFSKFRMIQFTCTKDICRIIHKKLISDTKNTLHSHHCIEKDKLG